jgi:hypothetical protein
MSSQKMDALLPLTIRDYERFKILNQSLKKFFRDIGILWIVVPDQDFETLKTLIDDKYCVILQESILIPEFKVFPKLTKFTSGWFKQQLIKLAIAEKIETNFYLTLDADVICTKPIEFTDLVKNGRAVCYVAGDDHPDWYEWAEKVLNLRAKRHGIGHGVTPAIFCKEAVLKLQQHLTHLYQQKYFPCHKKRLLKLWMLSFFSTFVPEKLPLRDYLTSWRTYLLHCLPWTEYALYYTFLEATDLFQSYHVEINTNFHSEDSVWFREDSQNWDVDKVFAKNSNHFFFVFQSNTDVSADIIWEKVNSYLA